MKNIRSLILCACALAILPQALHAQTQNKNAPRKQSLHDQFSGQGYGVAGCGIGSVVFGPKPGMIQIISSTLNDTVGSQTFGISSGTSNCDIKHSGMEAASYIEMNKETLSKEVARGEGDTIEALAMILKCSNAQSFGEKLRTHYQDIMSPNFDSYEKTRRILHLIDGDADLRNSCEKIG